MRARAGGTLVFHENRCLGCRSCELACSLSHTASKEIAEAVARNERPIRRRWLRSGPAGRVSIACRHCDPAPCVRACIAGAMTKGPEGETRHDPEQCVGCFMCIMVCPFGALRRLPDRPHVVLCDLCPEEDGAPACVAGCPTKALRIEGMEEET